MSKHNYPIYTESGQEWSETIMEDVGSLEFIQSSQFWMPPGPYVRELILKMLRTIMGQSAVEMNLQFGVCSWEIFAKVKS